MTDSFLVVSPSARFPAGRGGPQRDAGIPSESVERKIWLLLRLLRDGRIDVVTYVKRFERSERSFKRDLQHLRKLGERHGYQIGHVRGGRACLTEPPLWLARREARAAT